MRFFALIALALLVLSGCTAATPAGPGRTVAVPSPTLSPEPGPPASPTLQPSPTLPATAVPSATATTAATDVPATTAAPTVAPAAATAFAWRRGGGEGRFSTLGGLDVYRDRLYVADAYGGALLFDLEGGEQGVISAGEIVYITDVKVGPAGTVFIADGGLHQITRFSAEHDLLGGFGAYGTGDGEFGSNGPAALAVGLEGEVYALDPNVDTAGRPLYRVQVFDEEGRFLRVFPAEPGADSVGMDVGPDGTLFIVSRQGYVAEVEPEEGRLIARLGLEALKGAYPQMIAIDDAGNLYVTTQIPTAVAVLAAQGHALVERVGGEGVRTAEGWPEGEFLLPYGVAVSRDGKQVYVGDTAEMFAYVTAFSRP